ncbi:hypothetical protein [uncultured Litoreibacter sp.]|uniref:amino acid kinase family protein n=1 Tax=uncultured Litoreibacter sp. TaxID=1392394 RepID=UPI00260E89A3|nr:hypothetical protein [uncultured Litoreibacter sp.]
MRIVVALGGKAISEEPALLGRSALERLVRPAADALVDLVGEHELVVIFNLAPSELGQIGLSGSAPTIFDGGAEVHSDVDKTSELAGYLLGRGVEANLEDDTPLAVLLTTMEIDGSHASFVTKQRLIGPTYSKKEAERLAEGRGWQIQRSKGGWRRVIPAPAPTKVYQIKPIRWLIEKGTVVFCAIGGVFDAASANGKLDPDHNTIVDKDLASEFLARELEADLFVLATNTDAVYLDWGGPNQRKIRNGSPDELEAYEFDDDTIAPKVAAACQFARETGNSAAIGALRDLGEIVEGKRGTTISPYVEGVTSQEARLEKPSGN